MKRITVSLPDDLADVLQHEARRRRSSVSDVMRAAVTSHFKLDQPRELPFANVGRSGHSDTAARAEEILAAEWADAIRADAFNSNR